MSAIATRMWSRRLCRQASLLNTHTRYLHTAILDYVERLTATFDASLVTAILTCTGSEANDIALRMAQAASGKMGIIATDATYHGNTAAVSQLEHAHAADRRPRRPCQAGAGARQLSPSRRDGQRQGLWRRRASGDRFAGEGGHRPVRHHPVSAARQ